MRFLLGILNENRLKYIELQSNNGTGAFTSGSDLYQFMRPFGYPLFLEILIRASCISSFKVGKDFDHFMRTFGGYLFLEILIRDTTLTRSKLFQGFFPFLAENGFKAGKDFERLTWLARMRISKNRSGKEPYAIRIKISTNRSVTDRDRCKKS